MNRPDDLRRALDGIAAGTKTPHEVLVSSDGDAAPTMDVVRNYEWATYQEGPHRGLSANRNACLDATTGTHVAFIDDDVIVPSRFVEVAESCAQEIGQTEIATGHEMRHDQSPSHKVTPHNSDWLGFQRKPPRVALRAIVINSTVFPRSLFDKVRFDQRLMYGYEEIDMARRAVHLGYRIRSFNELWVDHYPSPINRAGYATHLTTSRLYSTMKAYMFYERSLPKSVGYAVMAPAHAIAGALVHRRDVPAELRSIGRAAKGVWCELRVDSGDGGARR